MSENTKLVPKRRFKEFQNAGAWEERELSDLCEKFTDGDWIEAKDQSSEGIRLIQTGNVGVTRYLDKPNNTKWISEDAFDSLNCKEIFPGDILISRLPEPAGRACIMPDIGQRMITAVDCTIVRVKSDIDNKYLVQYLTTNDYFSEVNIGLAGGTRQRISRSNLAKLLIPIPKNDLEQKKIGQHFENLDDLITLHQHKLEKTKSLKSAYLSELFPIEGEREPKRRFAGFADAWEQRKLSEVAKYRNGKAHENDISEKGKYVVVNSKFVSTDGKIRKYSEKQIEPLYKDEIAFVLSDVPNGRAIARTFLVEKDHKYTLNQRIAGIKPNEKAYPYFLHILLNRNRYFLQFDDGAKQTNLSVDDVMNFDDFYPSEEEQRKIGDFFQQIDNLITLHQHELNKLQNIKKAFLNEMFI